MKMVQVKRLLVILNIFNYNPLSYYDIDLAMLKYRQDQPKPGNTIELHVLTL